MRLIILTFLICLGKICHAQYDIEYSEKYEVGLGFAYMPSLAKSIDNYTDLFVNAKSMDYEIQFFGNYLWKKDLGLTIEFSVSMDADKKKLEEEVFEQILKDYNNEYLFLENTFEKSIADNDVFSTVSLSAFKVYNVKKLELRPYIGLGFFYLPTYSFQGYLKKRNANDILNVSTYSENEGMNLSLKTGVNILYSINQFFSIAAYYKGTYLFSHLTYIENVRNNFTSESYTNSFESNNLFLQYVGLKLIYKFDNGYPIENN